ncbi:hypothetical protein QBK93_11145 [Rhizobium leguminosarum]|uniref:hypothetical protein n=1 Tax=Rhizobium leguminosarum TaxID=384 RepID=UPI0024A7DBE4|nr:hypothetical protein [Rhizobium leguminosarum]MDI5925229.1 hypothetical protein [Rhizobium leguminosarum]
MSSLFTLQIDQPFTRSSGHGAVVTVRQVADESGRYPDQPFETAIVAEGSRGATVTVPSGRYRLEARLPDGRVLRESRSIGDNSSEIVRFDAFGSLHEWLGWQTLAGNMPQREDFLRRLDTHFLRNQAFAQTISSPSLRLFSVVATMTGLDTFQEVEPPSDFMSDDVVGLWTLGASVQVGFQQNGSTARDRPQRMAALIPTARSWMFAFLPLPWTTVDGMPAELELLYDPTLPNDRVLRVSVIDGERSALLSYLGSSRMYEATVAFDSGRYGDQILQLMEEKRQNPLAAAAAAYAGLSFAVGDKRREDWSPWLANLMNWFPSIPDGAILFARDKIERAKTEQDLVTALDALLKAYLRGPPYFSVGIRHLLDGLTSLLPMARKYGLDDDQIIGIYHQVSRFALLADPDQTFTVLKLSRGSSDV